MERIIVDVKEGTQVVLVIPLEEEQEILERAIQTNNIVPATISRWQLRKALNQLSWRSSVETVIAPSPVDVRDGWEVADFFLRTHPLVIGIGQALGKTNKDLDDLFILAASL